MNAKVKKSIAAAVVLFIAYLILGAAAVAARAAGTTYYICYQSDDYRVTASNALKNQGDVYTVSPHLTRGDKFFISDGAGRLWGDRKGQPVTVTKSGTARYTVTFRPDTAFDDGSHISLADYAPASFSLEAGGSSVPMTYRSVNAAFEEYYAQVTLEAGDTVTVTGEAGTYGETGLGTAGVTVGLAGTYRFTFTADAEHLYADDTYIAYTEVPELYLYDEDNHAPNEAYRLTRDEDAAYEQYRIRVEIPENDYVYSYSIYDAIADKTYLPSGDGVLTVKDKGGHWVLYSPEHIYDAAGDSVFHTGVERIEAYYDGWYVLGDVNGYTYVDDAAFGRIWRLILDETHKDFDRYTLTLYVTDEQLRAYDGRVEFYISDGGRIFRKPNGDNIGIDRAGEYELTFAPDHDYGRGYHYSYVRVGDDSVAQTVTIGSAQAFADFLAACTSPEYSLDKTFVLTCDVDLSGTSPVPARIFAGTFDGLYRTVSGVGLTGENEYTALFERVTAEGVVRRATFDVDLAGKGRYTGLVGENAGRIEEVTVSGRVDGYDYAGAVTAVNTGTGSVENCSTRAAVYGVLNVGGVAGFNAGRIYDCDNGGAVNDRSFGTSDAQAMMNVGGVAGYSTGRIEGCVNTGTVGSGQGRYVGGIAGLSGGVLNMNVNRGTVSADSAAGGIVGYYGRLQQEQTDGLTQAVEDFLDKYFGSDNGPVFEESADGGVYQIYYGFNHGAVTAETVAGGVAGHASAGGLEIVGCLSTGAVTAHSSRAGGIVGEAGESTVSDCITYGDVIARKGGHAGGIVGSSTGIVRYCQTSAYVEAGGGIAGGIAGSADTLIGCISNAFVSVGEGDRSGLIAGEAPPDKARYNYYVAGKPLGIGGIEYGASSAYAACGLPASEMMSIGMLSPALYGLDPAHYLAGENEARFPVPRAFEEAVVPDVPDEAAYRVRFAGIEADGLAVADAGGKAVVTVTFYSYDFDAETYERLTAFRLHTGEGIEADKVPAVPEKEGYFVWWDRNDFTSFDQNTSVYQKVDRAVTTLSSDDGARPAVLVEGMFRSDTVLELIYNGDYVSLRFTRGGVPVDYGDVTVRYHVGDPDGYSVKLIRGEEMRDAETAVSGEYMIFTLPDGYGFAAVAGSRSLLALWVTLAAVGGAAAAALACGIAWAVVRVRRKKAGATGALEDADRQGPKDILP